MNTYQVEISRTISTTVTVQAESAEAAADLVDDVDFPLSVRDDWTGHKDWTYRATNIADETDTYDSDEG